MRKIILAFCAFALLLYGAADSFAQTADIDYSSPRKYIVGGVDVEGNSYVSKTQITQLSGLHEGMEVTVPSDDISSIISRIWAQRYFQDVAVRVDSLSSQRDTAWFMISVRERPRMSQWTYTGVRSGEKKDLDERINFRRGGVFSEYISKTTTDIIRRYYKEKGEKIRIKDINFVGNTDISEYKLAKSMKKTKSRKIYNFFHSKKFSEKEYPEDKKNLVSAYNERGYRDAHLVRDSVYAMTPERLGIDLDVEAGKKYYFRNITWTGNSVYTAEQLNSILQIKKGDVYDLVTMQKRIYGGGKQGDADVSKAYRDVGYLFFSISPVELNVVGDSVDVEMRIVEGKQATLNNIIINGNDLTNEKVVRRQIYTRPGYLFSQTDFERSIREIASLGQFDPEAIMSEKGYTLTPNPLDNTVDIIYNVTEKPSSQLELSGGWGGNTFVATAGVSFNNFSTKRMFDKGAWRPVPLGDAQTLSLHFQTSGTYYTAFSASFQEPWLFGKKPTSLSLSAYLTRQTNSYLAWNIKSHDREMRIYGVSAGIGTRLRWPDSYFTLYNQLSWQAYDLHNWYSNNFIFNTGVSHNLSYTLSLSRNSTDQQIFPRMGQSIEMSVSLTPPYSLFRKHSYDTEGNRISVDDYKDVNYDNWTASKRYKWIEYHKWSFKANFYQKLIGDLVLRTRAQFGYLGYYNRKWGYSPFEGYDKFTVELRYPVILQPQSTIFVLAFLEGGNCWADIRDFNPFQIKRSAGVGVRIYLPMIGLLGLDWAYGFDDSTIGGSQFHFLIGQEF